MERIDYIANFLNNCIDYDKKVTPIPRPESQRNQDIRVPYIKVVSKSVEWIASYVIDIDNTFVIAKKDTHPYMYKVENYLVDRGLRFLKNSVFRTPDRLNIDETKETVIVLISNMTAQDIFRSCSRATSNLYIIDDLKGPPPPIIFDNRYLRDDNPRCTIKRTEAPPLAPSPYTNICIKQLRAPYMEPPRLPSYTSDINGLAIPIIYEYRLTGKITLLGLLKDQVQKNKYIQERREILSYIDKIEALGSGSISVPDILKISNIYAAISGKYKSRLYNYNYTFSEWLTEDDIKRCLDVLDSQLAQSSSLQFEVLIGKYRVDIVDKNTGIIWEIKCKKRILESDLEQIKKYACEGGTECRLLNLYTGEMYQAAKQVGSD